MTPTLEHTGTEVPTMTQTESQDLNTLDVGELNFDAMGTYEEPSRGFGTITPGRYRLEMPQVITGKVIEVGGQKALEFELEGLRIADGEPFAKQRIFNAKVSTLAIKAKGKTLAASDAWDLLRNFGLAGDTQPTPQEFIEGFQHIQGQVTPAGVEVTLKGSYQDAPGTAAVKGRSSAANANGWVNLYQGAFADGKGGFNPTIEVNTQGGGTVTVKAKAAIAWRGWAVPKGT